MNSAGARTFTPCRALTGKWRLFPLTTTASAPVSFMVNLSTPCAVWKLQAPRIREWAERAYRRRNAYGTSTAGKVSGELTTKSVGSAKDTKLSHNGLPSPR